MFEDVPGHGIKANVRCGPNRFVIVCECGKTFLSNYGLTLAGLSWATHVDHVENPPDDKWVVTAAFPKDRYQVRETETEWELLTIEDHGAFT